MKLIISEKTSFSLNSDLVLVFNKEDLDLAWGMFSYFKLIGLPVNYDPNEYGFEDKESFYNMTSSTEPVTNLYTNVLDILDAEEEAIKEYLKLHGQDTTIYRVRCGNNDETQGESLYSLQPLDGCGDQDGRGVDRHP